MPNIFSMRPGRVVKVPGANHPDGASSTVMNLVLGGWLGYHQFKSIITSVGLNEQVAIQFLSTLQNYVYVYIFGDAPTTLQVGGYSFAEGCDTTQSETGIDAVMRYYRMHRASTRGISVGIGLSAIGMQGYLVGAKIVSQDPGTTLCQFSLDFVCPSLGATN